MLMKLTPYRREDPFRLLRDFGSEIERFFESPFGALKEETQVLAPSLDLSEDKDNIYVEANLPGFEQKDVKLKMSGDALVLSAQRESEKKESLPAGKGKKKTYYRCERHQGSFYREINLPQAVDAQKIKAKYKNGVLKVTLPKKEREKEKEISVDLE